MKQPKTINGLIKAIERAVEQKNYVIRKIWRCNAGFGMSYVNPSTHKYVVHTYYPTLEACVKGEYKRVVLNKKERGGYYL